MQELIRNDEQGHTGYNINMYVYKNPLCDYETVKKNNLKPKKSVPQSKRTKHKGKTPIH